MIKSCPSALRAQGMLAASMGDQLLGINFAARAADAFLLALLLSIKVSFELRARGICPCARGACVPARAGAQRLDIPRNARGACVPAW